MKAAMAYVEGRDAGIPGRPSPTALKIQPDLRRDPSHRRRGHRALLPLRRSGRAHAQGDRARSREHPRRRRPRRAVDAHRRRAQRAPQSRDGVPRSTAGTCMTYNLLELLDNLEPFDTIKEGDMIIRLAPDESPVMKNYVPMLAQRVARRAEQAMGVHAEGPDPGRDVPEARRLRGAHARPARHDRRARRLLRPRRHARFAEGARARHVQLGRDAVARDGARDHAAAVEQPPAAVAERRHLGVRGAARPRRLGPRHGHPVRARDRSRRA